jgi:hypothetical protein
MLFKEQRILDFSTPGQCKETIMSAKEVTARMVARYMDRNMAASVYLSRFIPKHDKWSAYVAIQKAIRPPKGNTVEILGDNVQLNHTFDNIT